MTGESTDSPVSSYWPQELEYTLCRLLPGTNLASLDETDIETLFDFVSYLTQKDKQTDEDEKSVTINGKKYKLVDRFSEKI